MRIFEVLMLICFGAAWPFSIARALRSRSTGGKSIVFLLIIILGYVAGIINKILAGADCVIYLYCLNLVMVSIDALLWLRNHRLEKAETDVPPTV